MGYHGSLLATLPDCDHLSYLQHNTQEDRHIMTYSIKIELPGLYKLTVIGAQSVTYHQSMLDALLYLLTYYPESF